MVYIANWQEFQEAAECLYEKSPNNTRYCVKWKSSEGKLVLRITDNTTCLKFKTYSSIFLNRFEALNLALLQKMQNRQAVAKPALTPEHESRADTPTIGAKSVPAAASVSAAPTAAAGGVKKKKPNKKKK